MPTAGLWLLEPGAPRIRLPSALYDVKCDPGFRCVSKVSDFGLHHDGNYRAEDLGKDAIAARYNSAYEVGCPARGTSHALGQCTDVGLGPQFYCWSPQRFEAGETVPCGAEDSGKCLCVRNTSNAGDTLDKEVPNQHAQVKEGEDLQTGMWPVETYKQLKCRECSQHDQSQEDCLACAPKCDYGTKELSGIKITGCFNSENYAFDKKEAEKQAAERLKEATKDAPQGEAAVKQELQAYETKETPETESKRLSVIPHYRLWDPKAHDDFGDLKQPRPETGGYFQGEKLPWEGRDTFLSARAWVDRFPQAAPHIQHLLDKVYTLLATKGNLGAIPCDGTGTRNAGIGQLIIGTQTSQKACNEMQETAATLAQAIKFGKEADGQQIHCVMGEGGRCERLNCYTGDEKIERAIDKLKIRQHKMCHAVDEMLKEEEATNGKPPAFEGNSLRQNAGALDPYMVEQEGREVPAASGPEATEHGFGHLAMAAFLEAPKGPRRCRRDFVNFLVA